MESNVKVVAGFGEAGAEGVRGTSLEVRLNRVAVSALFFMHGLCFASWASRIPTIQVNLGLSESALGTVLFALPVGFFVSLPFAGVLVGLLGSRRVAVLASVFYALALVAIGLAANAVGLFGCLFLLGFFANLLNISINTQAVAVEGMYKKKIMASFHGIWSLAGFAGAAIGTWMIGKGYSPFQHYVCVGILFIVVNALSAAYLVRKDEATGEKRPLFAMPDKSLLGLGIIAFCSMMVEGAMFDWSGIYFTKVLTVAPEYAGLGYTTFMVAMAAMRFMADGLTGKVGLTRMLQISGALATAGLLLSVIFPQMMPALAGFFFIGMGVSSVVPLVYSAAGKSESLSAGTALTAVSSLGFMGLLIGPPIIGFIADATSLRISFLAISVMSLAVVVLSTTMAARAAHKDQ